MSAISPAIVSRSGRFSVGPSAAVAAFSESISFDWRLWRQDIQGSLAHAAMLHRIGVLSAAELAEIQSGFAAIRSEIEAGTFEWKPELEDIHMNLEAELTRRCPAGARLHTGRSRNDQVALDMRLWLRDETTLVLEDLRGLQRSLVGLASRYPAVVIPGYTHLQRAQPVYWGHHLLAYVEMLQRDADRFSDACDRFNVCPLGSGAIAGSTLALDRDFVARELGFVDEHGGARITQNSMDAVSDRDFVIEFCAAAALAAVHLSRLSEDIILWVTAEFNFLRLSDAFTTGSSLMPQKRNPDIAEITRGKTGRVVGNLTSLLVLLKGLPMTYNRDLQEDKQRLFDSSDTIRSCLQLMAAMLEEASVHEQVCAVASRDPQLLATDLADNLVRQGLPFREAHHLVGSVVGLAERTGRPLDQLSLADFQSVSPLFTAEVVAVFDLNVALQHRNLVGAPGTAQVEHQLIRWRQTLGMPTVV